MIEEQAIEILEKEKAYMLAHGGDRQFMALDMAIKRLKQQPTCDDCVSRQAIDHLCFEYLRPNTDDNIAFYEHFCDLPPVTPTQSWIPVSERLPNTNETVLCWYEYYHWSLEKVLPEYGLGCYFKEVGAWGGEVANGLKAKVLAWQPLPKPYEEKRGNENG